MTVIGTHICNISYLVKALIAIFLLLKQVSRHCFSCSLISIVLNLIHSVEHIEYRAEEYPKKTVLADSASSYRVIYSFKLVFFLLVEGIGKL